MTASTSSPHSRWKILREGMLVGLFFLGFTAILYREAIFSLSRSVLAGQQCGGYFCWLFWWRLHALQHGLSPFYTTNLMFPVGTPVFPNAPLTECVSILIAWISNPYMAVNLALLSSYILAGLAGYALLKYLTNDAFASLCGAFIYAFSEYMLVQHFHGQIIETSIYFNPLLVLTLIRFKRDPSNKNAAWTGASFLGVVLSGAYMGFAAGIFLLGTLVYECISGNIRRLDNSAALKLFIAFAIPTIIAATCFWPLVKWSGQLRGGEFFYMHFLSSYVTPPVLQRQSHVLPEMSMGYLGLGPILLIVYGIVRKLTREETFAFFLWILGLTLVFSLGPWLTINDHLTLKLPLPYLVFKKLPFFSNFRVPGRLMSIATLASAVLSAYALRHGWNGKSMTWRFMLTVAFVAFTTWEFDMGFNVQRRALSKPPVLYDTIKTDPDDFAIMELPLPYSRDDIFIRAQLYMLYQVYHQRPMLLGYPPRFLSNSLTFTDKTDVVYELTHPEVLLQLESDDRLKTRAAWIAANGAAVLKAHKIKYVVLHDNLPAYSPVIRDAQQRWIEKILGAPIQTDSNGLKLYRSW